MSFLIEHETLEVEENLDKDGEIGLIINGKHGDDERYAWINKEQAEDMIKKLKNAFAL